VSTSAVIAPREPADRGNELVTLAWDQLGEVLVPPQALIIERESMKQGPESVSGWPFELPRSGRDAVSHAINPLDATLFREYDVRGKTTAVDGEPGPMNEFSANRIGRAFGTLMSQRGVTRVAVGFDSRSYSESLANALIAGLLSTGADVTQLGLATTPLVYFAQHFLGGTAGVSVTASHNPNGWAGLKLSFEPSVTLGPIEVAELHELADSRRFVSGSGRYSERSITKDYTDFLGDKLRTASPLTVVLDGGNSISGPLAELALVAAGHNVTVINRELDWTFPNHEPDPETMLARAQISEAVRATKADVGISLDGDGDRLGITDDEGQIVWSDRVLALMAQDTLSRHPGAQIVFDVKCSRVVPQTIEAAGGVPLMWKTGHSHIKTKMREVGAPFAGERSGHFFDAGDYYGYDDAIYAALRFLAIMGERQGAVSEVMAGFPVYHGTPTMQAACADETKYDVVERFAEYAEALGATELVRINGVRAEFEDGWLLVRASSNLPSLVIVAEAETEERLRELYALLRKGLADQPDVSSEWENDPYADHRA